MRKMVKPHKVRKTPPSIGIAWYYDGKDETWYDELNNSTLGTGIKLLDPTGVSSYYDVYQSARNMYDNPSLGNAGSLALELFGALPLVGKIGKAFKWGNKLIKTVDGPGDEIGRAFFNGVGQRAVGGSKDIYDNSKKEQSYDEGKDDIKQKHQNAKQWMFNWLSNRLPQLERNADATSYRYQLYTPKIKSGDVRERGWNVDYYNNYYNPLAYLKNSTPQRNRLMKLVHSQVNNATNTPYQSVGPQVVGGIGNVKGVYVKPNHFNNSGNYIAYDGIPENDVVVHEMTHASHPNPQIGYITDAIFDGNVPDVGAGGKNNRDRADEIYGALQQFRYKSKISPKQTVDQEWLNNNRKYLNGTYIQKLPDDIIIRLMNEVAHVPTNSNIFYANSGKDSGIHIKKANRGKFTAAAERAGMGVQAYARKILRAPKGKYSSTLRKRANFAANAAKWHK